MSLRLRPAPPRRDLPHRHLPSLPMLQRTLLVLSLPLLLLCACSSTGASAARGDAISIRLRDYREGVPLRLVNDSFLSKNGIEGEDEHERKSNFYAQARQSGTSGTKVASDEILEETVRFLNEKSYASLSLDGPAPTRAGQYTSAIEVTVNNATSHFGMSDGTDRNAAQRYLEWKLEVANLYNNVYGLQRVEDDFRFEADRVLPGKGSVQR